MKPGEIPSQRGHFAAPGLAREDEPAQSVVFAKLAHLEGVLFDLAFAVDAKRAVGTAPDFRHAQIHIWRYRAIEFELGEGKPAALFERGEIEESEVDRLLDLVNVLTSQEQVGYVGLDQTHRRFDPVRIRGGLH